MGTITKGTHSHLEYLKRRDSMKSTIISLSTQ